MGAISDPEQVDLVRPVPRRPWIAAVLSILLAGLGHVYSGAPLRGLSAWILTVVAGVAGLAIAVALPTWAELPAIAAIITASLLGVAWDAARTARQRSLTFQLRPYNRWYVYVGLFVFSALVTQPLLVRSMRATVANAYKVPTGSMEPTLLTGDYILAVPLHSPVQRGQVIVYRLARAVFVKRVVGLPGDTLAMQNGLLIVNGHRLSEPYARRSDQDRVEPEFAWQRAYLLPGTDTATYHPSLRSWGPLLLPPEKYFVLGDNRAESYDSRYTGLVAQADLIARPTVVYFSREAATGAIRWGRIAHSAR